MGKSSYYLMRTDSGMDIMAENGDCPRKNHTILLSIFTIFEDYFNSFHHSDF